jgi:putative acetyltransferase
MVTHSSTSRPVQCLCMAERTGCPVFTDLWSYVPNGTKLMYMLLSVILGIAAPGTFLRTMLLPSLAILTLYLLFPRSSRSRMATYCILKYSASVVIEKYISSKMTTHLPQNDMPDSASIEVRLTSLHDVHIIDLSSRQREEILRTDPTLGAFTAEIPVMMVLIREGKAIACGGLCLVDEGVNSVAEIKRVYVLPEARGQAKGVSDLLLKHLEQHASKLGWASLRLQTRKDMAAANRFYERHGYGLIPNYGEYVDCTYTVSYEKVIVY